MHIENCTSCKGGHDVSVTKKTASNGRPYVQYVCPETGKNVTRFVKGATTAAAPKPAPSPAPKAATPSHSGSGGDRASGGPGNDIINAGEGTLIVNPPAPTPPPAKRPRGGHNGGSPAATPPGGSMSKGHSVSLQSEFVTRLVTASGWDVCTGFHERLTELGVGTQSVPSILAHADAEARRAMAPQTGAQARKDSEEKQVGRDLADIWVTYMAANRIGPADYGAMYPKALGIAWAQDPSGFSPPGSPAAGSPGAAPSGGGGGGNGGGGALPNLSGAFGDKPAPVEETQGEAPVEETQGEAPPAPQGDGTPNGLDANGDGQITLTERMHDNPGWFSGHRAATAFTGALAGSELGIPGMIAGGIAGYVAPELADSMQQVLGDNAAPAVKVGAQLLKPRGQRSAAVVEKIGEQMPLIEQQQTGP